MTIRVSLPLFAAVIILLAAAPFALSAPVTGVYRITPRLASGDCLDIAGFGNTDNTSVQMWYANHTSNQQWLVEDQGDGTYKIYAYSGQNSFEMLNDNDGALASGTPVNIYSDNGTPSERWIFSPSAPGWYRIIPATAGAASSQTLEVSGGVSAKAGALMDIGSYTAAPNQVFRLDWSGPSQILSNPKKGMAYTGSPSVRNFYLHCSWFYDWGGGEPGDMPQGVEFVPMIWGYYPGGTPQQNAQNQLNYNTWAATQPGVKNLLGFNEPDQSGQSDLSVGSALDGFQYISDMKSLGVGIGSPAAADDEDSWMWDFMQGAGADNYNIDFVAIHEYPAGSDMGASIANFENFVQSVYDEYGKPVWVTEFAPLDDWAGNALLPVSSVEQFMEAVVPWLNSQWYVARYSWYATTPGDSVLGTAALVNYDGTPTELGKLYARM